MSKRRRWLGRFLLLGAAGLVFVPLAWAGAKPLQVTVATADPTGMAWSAADKWRSMAPITLSLHAQPGDEIPSEADIVIVPVPVFAGQIPAASVLDLPFLFPDMEEVHRALDGQLGMALQQASKNGGWHLLAIWDEGMQSLSGNQPYNQVQNLAGIEFAVTRLDPVEEKTFKALDAWTRNVRSNALERMAQECLVNSRSATLQEMWHENLYRVHLNLTLTQHRYEGWVVAIPNRKWKKLSNAFRRKLVASVRETTSWERKESAQREARSLQQLQEAGLDTVEMSTSERDAMRARLVPLEHLLPDAVSPSLGRHLLALAAAGSRAAPRLGGRGKPLLQAQPDAPGGQPGNHEGGASGDGR